MYVQSKSSVRVSPLYFRGEMEEQPNCIAFEVFYNIPLVLTHFNAKAQVKSFDQELKNYDFCTLVLTSAGTVQFRTTPSKFVKTAQHIRSYIQGNRLMRTAHSTSPVVKTKLLGEPTVQRMLKLNQLAEKAELKVLRAGSYSAEWTI